MLELERHFEHEATERREQWSDLSQEVTALTKLIKWNIVVNDITLIFDANEEKLTLMDHLCLILMTMKNNIVICMNKCFTSMAVVSSQITAMVMITDVAAKPRYLAIPLPRGLLRPTHPILVAKSPAFITTALDLIAKFSAGQQKQLAGSSSIMKGDIRIWSIAAQSTLVLGGTIQVSQQGAGQLCRGPTSTKL